MVARENSSVDGDDIPNALSRAEQGPGAIGGQARRFIIVGIIATGAHFLTLSAAIHVFRVPSLAFATAIGTCLGIIVSYLGHHRYTFAAAGRHVHRFSLFVVVYGVVMSLHAGLMYFMGDILGWAYAIPFVVATVISSATTFVLTRQFVFRPASEG